MLAAIHFCYHVRGCFKRESSENGNVFVTNFGREMEAVEAVPWPFSAAKEGHNWQQIGDQIGSKLFAISAMSEPFGRYTSFDLV